MTDPFRVLVADPPWTFGDKLGRRGASANYPCLSVDDLARFPLPPLSINSYLFLWRVAAMQADALWLMEQWGFTAKAELVWFKTTKMGKPHFGLGHHVRNGHEVCLIGTRGKPKPQSRSVRSVFMAEVGRHSEKPDAFYALVERFADGPYAELFARRARLGWSCWGNELAEAHP